MDSGRSTLGSCSEARPPKFRHQNPPEFWLGHFDRLAARPCRQARTESGSRFCRKTRIGCSALPPQNRTPFSDSFQGDFLVSAQGRFPPFHIDSHSLDECIWVSTEEMFPHLTPPRTGRFPRSVTSIRQDFRPRSVPPLGQKIASWPHRWTPAFWKTPEPIFFWSQSHEDRQHCCHPSCNLFLFGRCLGLGTEAELPLRRVAAELSALADMRPGVWEHRGLPRDGSSADPHPVRGARLITCGERSCRLGPAARHRSLGRSRLPASLAGSASVSPPRPRSALTMGLSLSDLSGVARNSA